MAYITQLNGYLFLIIFGLCMTVITLFFSKKQQTKNGFLLANRKLNWFLGGTSIAASWIWAPALFVSVQVAFEMGIGGVFWFTMPNILALLLFVFFAPKIRERFTNGFTLPQYIKSKLGKYAHIVYLVPYVFYQIMAVTVQLFAGGSLLSLLTGIPLLFVMPLLTLIALTYTFISGLKASVITDVIQLGLIFVIGTIIIPMVIFSSNLQWEFIPLHSLIGEITNPTTAFSFGIVTAIGLLAGALSDQQYWQRSFAIKKQDLRKSFIFGALLFGIVPIALSTLGFTAQALHITLPTGIDTSMIGVQTVATLLPSWALLLFVIMLLAGLTSTLDSGLSAFSSLWIIDITKPKNEKQSIFHAKLSMLIVSFIGLLIAICVYSIPHFGLQHLWWIFNTIAACIFIPTILTLYWNKLTEKGVVTGITITFVIGIPLFIYGNIIGNSLWIVGSVLFILLISSFFCIFFRKKKIKETLSSL